MNLLRLAVLGACLGLLLARPAAALDTSRTLRQLRHTAWTAREGAPTDVAAITQTPDGYVWFATPVDVVRFDGVAFERIDVYPGEPGREQGANGLYVGRDGALWIGTWDGRIVRRDARGSRVYGPGQGVTRGVVMGFAQTADGRLWAAARGGALRLDGDRWVPVGADMDYPVGAGANFGEDGAGGLLAVDETTGRWYALAPNAPRFVRRPELDGSLDVARAPDGAAWVWDPRRLLRRADDAQADHAFAIDFQQGTLGFDRDGALWVATYGDGLRRLACQEAARAAGAPACAWERMGQADGLSGSRVMSRFEDAQGNLWFGTTGGIDRFSDTRVVLAPYEKNPEDGALAALADGGVLAATIGQTPKRLDARGGVADLPGDFTPRDQVFSSAFADDDGSVWFGGLPDLWHVVDGHVTRLPAPPGITFHQKAQAIGRDAQGGLWAAFRSEGVFRWDGRAWTRMPLPADEGFVNAFQRDPSGAFWRATSRGQVIRRDATGERAWGAAQGLAIGEVTSLDTRAGHVLAAGMAGVALLRGERFEPLVLDDGTSPSQVAGFVQTRDGELWLNEAGGLIHVGAAEFARFLADPRHRVGFERIDWRDGFYGRPPRLLPAPSALEAADGRLWFSRESAIFWIDPHKRYAQAPRPDVVVSSVTAPGLGPLADGAALPPLTPSISIAYGAFDLVAPERLQFRLRLVGLAPAWQDVGPRRTTTFGRLPPGAYRFEVQAFEPGGWTSAPRAFSFSVRPAWYQTTAWHLLVAALVALAAIALLRRRTTALVRRLNEQAQARLAERARIARDLHDTLLQGTQGLVLGLQAIAGEMPAGDDRRRRIETLLDDADAVVAEARDRVHGLRDLDLERLVLVDELTRAGRDLAARSGIRFELRLEAELPPLRPEVCAEVFLALREALLNAFRHARAGVVTLWVRRRDGIFSVAVHDDGVGIDAATLAHGGRAGHWGLAGMRERAARVGARVAIDSAPGGGTEVRIELAHRALFDRPPARAWRRWRRSPPEVSGRPGA